MRFYIPSSAIGLVLAAGMPAAHAQTVITSQVINPALETVQTTETRSVRPARTARRQVVTTRTVTRRIVPAPTVIARTVPVAPPPPVYDEVAPAPIAASSDDYDDGYNYGPPLYDQAVPATAALATPVVQPGPFVAPAPVIYRYVYEPDRILVVDPTTNIAVQSIPR